MKKTVKYLALLAIIAMMSFTKNSNQTEEIPNKIQVLKNFEDYSNWVFVLSDKAMQMRFKLERQEGNIGYYSVQFRINFEDAIYCSSEACEGYLLTFGYPDLDGMKNIFSHYKFYNSYKEIYTMPELMPLNLLTRFGAKLYLKPEGFFFMLNNNELHAGDLFYDCVDEILNNSSENRCTGSYRDIYDESKAVILK